MATLLDTVLKIGIAQLNANPSAWSAVATDPKQRTEKLTALAKSAIGDFMSMVANAQDHPDAVQLSTDTAALASGTELTAATLPKNGAIVGVRVTFVSGTPADSTYWPAEAIPAEEVRLYLQDMQAPPAGLGLTMPWYVYAIDSGRLYHGGNLAKIRYIGDLSAVDVDSNQILQKYVWGVAALLMTFALPFMGETDTAAAHYAQLASQARELIVAGKPVPPFGPPKKG
jgi:hypothetical protein